MHHAILTLLIVGWTSCALAQDAASVITCPSPDGQFALRVTEPKGANPESPEAALIEKSSGKVIVNLGVVDAIYKDNSILVWSADSKWVAYGTRDNVEGETHVYYRTGADFEELDLPENLPSPDYKFRKRDDGGVKNYGAAVQPVRWLKPGLLELTSDSIKMARKTGVTYTGVIRFTVGFDSKHHATVRNVSKTKITFK